MLVLRIWYVYVVSLVCFMLFLGNSICRCVYVRLVYLCCIFALFVCPSFLCEYDSVDFWHYLHSSLISLLFIIRPSLLLRLYIYIYIYVDTNEEGSSKTNPTEKEGREGYTRWTRPTNNKSSYVEMQIFVYLSYTLSSMTVDWLFEMPLKNKRKSDQQHARQQLKRLKSN